MSTATHDPFDFFAPQQSFNNGGQIWACGTCTKPRDITEAQLIAGAKIVTAANVVEMLTQGTATLDF